MIIFFSICIVVLLGFAGFATDTGMIWVTRSRLQNSVDAGVLAAAQELPDPAAAEGVACTYATEENAVPGMFGETGSCSDDADVTFPADYGTGNSVRITAFRTVQPIFGQIVGFDPVEVWAEAEARIGSLGSACLFPLFLTTDQVTSSTEFFVPVKFSDANAAIDVGSGSQAVREAMADPRCGDDDDDDSPTSFDAEIGDEVDTKPGSATQFRGGWDRIEANATSAGSSCPNPDISTYTTQNAAGQTELLPSITIENCPRLIIVPVLPPGTYNGNASGIIQGFVPFYFAGVCDDKKGCTVPGIADPVERHKAWGYYVQLDLTSLTYSDYQPEFGTKIVSLAG